MRERLLPDIVPLSATALERWIRCPREYRDRDLLGLPESNPGPASGIGNLVHDLLRLIHEQGDCRDPAFVDDLLVGHGIVGPGPIPGFIERHARRCPSPVDRSRHEIDLARFHRAPAPMFMAIGRLDAIWIHDGTLDVRDYKTGGSHLQRVADDPRARLQAWLAAPIATRRGLRIRVRYEHLATEVDDDPDAYEPEPEEIAEVGEELRAVVEAIRAEETFAGVNDPAICGGCRYRGVCPDSAVPSEPTWPEPPT
jgi:RecB family exonuclease